MMKVNNAKMIGRKRKLIEESLRKTSEDLKFSEGNFQCIYENSPIALWHEDLSKIKEIIDELKNSGVKDFRSYLDEHPELVDEFVSLIIIKNVNKSTLNLIKAKNIDEIIENTDKIFTKIRSEVFKEEIISLVEENLNFESETIIYTLTGEKRNGILRLTVVSGYEQTWSKVLISILDITERKKAEEGLKDTLKEVKRINQEIYIKNLVFNSSLSAQCVADLNGIIISVNPAFLKLWGYESEVDAIGISLGDFFVNPDDATSVLEALVKPGEWKGNFLAKKSDGSHFISQALATPLYTENGEHIGFQSANIDITERIKSRKKLKNALEDLKRSNAELEQFAYVASHDLQEPLRMVASFTQLLQKRYIDKLDQDANDFINYAVDGAIRMQSLINDLLAFSRVGTQKAAFNETDMNLILEQVKSNLSYSIKDTGAIITNDPLPVVIADESQMIQLIQNLISNAIKFQKKNATPIIHISGKTEENQWIFSVKDNGIGIDPQFFDRIFIIFQRLHKKDEYGGTGIGLSVCRKIAQRHGGKIWIESEPDKGTTFYFTLKTSIKNAIIDEKMGEN